MSDLDKLRLLGMPGRIKVLITSYEKEIDMVKGILDDIGDNEKSRMIYETMLREKIMFLQVLKNIL